MIFNFSIKFVNVYRVLECTTVILESNLPRGFPGGSDGKDGKESACSAGDPGWIPGSERPLKKGMATHSSILAWETPWAEEPGGYSP